MVSGAKITWPVTMLGLQVQVEGKVETISSKDAFVSCKEMPPLDENLVMVVRIPNHKAINLNGKVAWLTVIDSNEDDPRFGLGVQFTRMSPADRRTLQGLIAKHYRLKTSGTT